MSSQPLPFQDLLPEGDFKACCASLYEAEPVRWLLDGQLHPGGEVLTRRMAELAGIGRSDRVLDVASGQGTTARLIAQELGADAVGLELADGAVAAASAAATETGLSGRATFVVGDAESLPFPAGSFDAVICECSLCTFPDKSAAAREMARVLKGGGRLGLSDVTAEVAKLPEPLRGAAARVACVADALSLEDYERLLRDTGFEVEATEEHDSALAAMIDRVEARLKVARMLRVPELERYRDEITAAIELTGLARRAVADGVLGYSVVVAHT